MKPWLHVETEETPDGTSVVIRGTFKDDSEPPVELLFTDFFEIKATLWDQRSGDTIENWEDRDVLTSGGNGSFTGSRYSLRFSPAETELLHKDAETRRLRLRYKYSGLNAEQKSGYAEVTFPIRRRP